MCVRCYRPSGKLENSHTNHKRKGEKVQRYIYDESLLYQWNIDTRSIYHLLCGAFCQCVPVTKVVYFNILYVVSIRNIHLTIDRARTVTRP